MFQYARGCTLEFVAPQAVAIEPEHDGWVVGDEAGVLIEFDFEGDIGSRLGTPEVACTGDRYAMAGCQVRLRASVVI